MNLQETQLRIALGLLRDKGFAASAAIPDLLAAADFDPVVRRQLVNNLDLLRALDPDGGMRIPGAVKMCEKWRPYLWSGKEQKSQKDAAYEIIKVVLPAAREKTRRRARQATRRSHRNVSPDRQRGLGGSHRLQSSRRPS